PARSVVLGFVALFALVLGVALLTPQATVVLVRGAVRRLRSLLGLLGTLAARGVVASLSRTGPAVVALVVAVSVTVGLGAMISSFRGTVSGWLDRTLQADVYVSLPGPGAAGPAGTIEAELARRIARVDGVSGASLYRSVEVEGWDGAIRVVAVRLDPRSRAAYRLVEGDGERALSRLESGSAALVSEPFAFRRRVGVGDTVRFRTGVGPRAIPVAGVFRDYGSDRGVVVLDRGLYDRWWRDPGYSSVALFVEEGLPPDSVIGRVQRAAGPGRSLVVRSNRGLRAASLEVFDRTFAVTGVLRLLAFAVAFIGILGALMALQLERSRELGVLRAQGLTPGQLWGVVTAQTGILGLVSGLLALPAGALLAVVMVHVVNRRSFGWTLDLAFGGDLVAETMILALTGALLAGLFPAWKMARTSPAEALRGE
ncbi:MAG TPA: FtsX-like permease family protein, partial [Longimicrobiales bacterium]|nr:FtsX-like permease family protein [Longimicrobiales bacterium]